MSSELKTLPLRSKETIRANCDFCFKVEEQEYYQSALNNEKPKHLDAAFQAKFEACFQDWDTEHHPLPFTKQGAEEDEAVPPAIYDDQIQAQPTKYHTQPSKPRSQPLPSEASFQAHYDSCFEVEDAEHYPFHSKGDATHQPTPLMDESQLCFKVTDHAIPCEHIREYARASVAEKDYPLVIAVKQYTPFDNPEPKPGDITIIGTHGDGLPKELYEPLWEDLYKRLKEEGLGVRGIWVADLSHPGASGMLNETNIGNEHLLSMINHFRKDMPRPLIGIGHSMGAGQLILLSLSRPHLLHTLTLIEPVFAPSTTHCNALTFFNSSHRCRDLWPSHAAFAASSKRSYKTWDPRVLERWLCYGARPIPTLLHQEAPYDAHLSHPANPSVTLTTTKDQKPLCYLCSNSEVPVDLLKKRADSIGPEESISPFYRLEPVIANTMLPYVRPSVLYVFGTDSPVSTAEVRAQKIKNTGAGFGGSGGWADGRVKEDLVEGGGHMVPLENVWECADKLSVWVGMEMERWRREEEMMRDEWGALRGRDKAVVPGDWRRWLDGEGESEKGVRGKL